MIESHIKNQMANVITGIRILCGLVILMVPAFSGAFYACFLLGGLTDAVDGTVARKLGQETDFGAKFDTVADFVFAIAVAVAIIPALSIPAWIVIWIAIIALGKIGSHFAGYIKYHEFKTVHSALNKVCGGVVFIVPLLIGGDFAWEIKLVIVIAACILASIAATVEAVVLLSKS